MATKNQQPIPDGNQKRYQPNSIPLTKPFEGKVEGGYQPTTSEAKPVANPPPKNHKYL